MSTDETSVIFNICDAYIKSGRTSNFVMNFNKNVDLWLHSTNEELFVFDKKFYIRCIFEVNAIKKFVEDFPGISIIHINDKKITLIDYHLETKMDQLINLINCPIIQLIIESFEPDFLSKAPKFTETQHFLNSNPTYKLFFLKICSQNQSRLSNSPEHKIINASSQLNEEKIACPLQPTNSNSNSISNLNLNSSIDPASTHNIQIPKPQSDSKDKLQLQSLNKLKEIQLQVYKDKNICQIPLESTEPKNRFFQNPETGLLESPQAVKVKKVKEQKIAKAPKDLGAPNQTKIPRKPKVVDPNKPPKEKKVRIKKDKKEEKEEKMAKEIKETKVINSAKEGDIKNVIPTDPRNSISAMPKDQKLSDNLKSKIEVMEMKNLFPQISSMSSVPFNLPKIKFDANKMIEVKKESFSKLDPAHIPLIAGKRGSQEAPISEFESSLKMQKIN